MNCLRYASFRVLGSGGGVGSRDSGVIWSRSHRHSVKHGTLPSHNYSSFAAEERGLGEACVAVSGGTES